MRYAPSLNMTGAGTCSQMRPSQPTIRIFHGVEKYFPCRGKTAKQFSMPWKIRKKTGPLPLSQLVSLIIITETTRPPVR